MPGFNGTGPAGYGPGTGRGVGPCGGGMGYGRGRGAGRGFGFSAGRSFGYQTTNISEEDEKQMLTEEAGFLEGQLNNIKSRLSRFKK